MYIGSTARSDNSRINEHKYKLRKNKHPNKHLQNTWNKYGESSFEFVKIEHTNSLTKVEKHYIEITGSFKKNYGFNKTTNTECARRGMKLTQEHKDKISKTLKGRVSPNKGKKLPSSKETIKKASEALKKKIECLNTGVVYSSVTEASKAQGVTQSAISTAVKKGYRCKGSYWRFV